MKEELLAVALKLWREHTGKCLGTFIGALAGIAIMIFGFFSVLFVAICCGLGYFIGMNAEKEGFWLDNIRNSIPRDIHRWR